MAEIVMIPVNQIHPHPKNPRKNIGDVTELANSIKAKGVLQNLTVVPGHWMTHEEWAEVSARYKENPTEEDRQLMNSKWLDTGYTVIIGHRRLAGSKQAGLVEVPCVVADLTDREQFDTMMVENVQRADLTIFEQAQGFQMMLDMGGTVESVAEQTGFSQSTVRSRLKLMKLDQVKLQQSMEREATLSDYMELDKIEDPKLRDKVLESIGTSNFRSELASALAKERTKRKMAEWIAYVSPFAEKVEKQDNKTMEYVRVLNSYNDPAEKGWEPPADTDTTKYFYRVEASYGVYLYREKIVDADEEERKRQKQAEAQQAFDRKKDEFEEISDRHYSLRNSFLMEFGAGKKYSVMTSKELADLLDGNQYGQEITKEQEVAAADSNLVVVFGYSDDDVELRGEINDEVGAYNGTSFHVNRKGVLHTHDCGCGECEYFAFAKKAAAEIKAIWHDTGDACWTFETQIPHETFRIYEDGDLFCIGIVFSVDDLPC